MMLAGWGRGAAEGGGARQRRCQRLASWPGAYVEPATPRRAWRQLPPRHSAATIQMATAPVLPLRSNPCPLSAKEKKSAQLTNGDGSPPSRAPPRAFRGRHC